MAMDKAKILVVEDNPVDRVLVEEILAEEFDFLTTASADEALAAIGDHRPDIILLDVMMPCIDGYQLCRMLREDPRHCFTKILFVSAKEALDERLAGYRAGADDFIVKPFDREELLAKVRVFLKLRRVEELDRLKSELLALIAHETRTPLNAIIGPVELLAEEEPLSEEGRTYVEMIGRGAQRLHELARKALLLCNLKGGRTLDPTPAPLEERLGAVVADLPNRPEEKGVALRLALEPVWLEVDWELFEDALRFVVDNAVKFSPAGGEVAVSGRGVPFGYELSVVDQGPGVAEQYRSRIFEEFSAPDIEHHHKGTGISLAIAKRIVEIHSGRIDVDAHERGGARFTLQLPSACLY